MPARRIPDHEKRLRATYHRSNSEATVMHGRTAIVEPLPPPAGLSTVERREWKLHMAACCAAGTLTTSNLLSFLAMIQVAAARAEALKVSRAKGPSMPDTRGSMKANPAWKAYMAADARYQTWAVHFGLTPYAAKGVPRLPPPHTDLVLVKGAR